MTTARRIVDRALYLYGFGLSPEAAMEAALNDYRCATSGDKLLAQRLFDAQVEKLEKSAGR